MVRLVYSNRTEELLAELAARVRAQQARDGALVPVRLVVPNGSVEGYVRLGIAREQGIAANLDASLLTRFAGEMTALLDRGARVADAEALEGMALALLLDDALVAGPELAPVRAYLHAAGDRPEAVDVRRVQLAARVGRLSRGHGRRGPSRCTGRWRRSSRGPSSCRARCTSSASRTWAGPSTSSSRGSGASSMSSSTRSPRARGSG